MPGIRSALSHGEKMGVYADDGARGSSEEDVKVTALRGDCSDGESGDPSRPRPSRP